MRALAVRGLLLFVNICRSAAFSSVSSQKRSKMSGVAAAGVKISRDGDRSGFSYIDVILCRHGETCHNAEGRCQGMEDVSRLTSKGESQALELGRALAARKQRFDRIFISPLARARHTFDLMEKEWRRLGWTDYPKCAPTFVPEIQEICLYDWQGHLRQDLQAQFPEEFHNWMNEPAIFRVGDHFPVRELWMRARRSWEQILTQSQPGERVLIVAHSGINQAMCFTALGYGETMYRRLNFPNCGALRLRLALPTSLAEATALVQVGGYTLPVTDSETMFAANECGEEDRPMRHYRPVHPNDWEPEEHLPTRMGLNPRETSAPAVGPTI